MRTPSFGSRGLTLIEMVTVLAIMSVLAVLIIGSFRWVQTTGLGASGNQIANALTMARENSISKNAYTAFVIKTSGTAAYSAYCLLQLVRNDDNSLPSSWTVLTPWKYLSTGVVFESSSSDTTNDTFITRGQYISSNTVTTNTPVALSSYLLSLPTSFSFQGQTINLTSSGVCACQCFLPDGTLFNASSAPVLRLILGAPAASGTGTMQQGTSQNYYNLTVLTNTGITVVTQP